MQSPPCGTVMVLLTQSCWSDMLVGRVARGLAWPPGAGTEQEVLLAAAVTTHLTNTIEAQFRQTATAAQHFHIKSMITQFGNFRFSRVLRLFEIFVCGKDSRLYTSRALICD